MESAVLGLSAAFSVFAALLAGASWSRGASAKVDRRVTDCEALASDTRRQFESFEASARTILGAVEDERERSVRAQRRASADRVKTEASASNSGGALTREDMLRDYRSSAGLS